MNTLSENREAMLMELDALLTGFWLTDLPNFCAFFFHKISGINWIGFYFSDGKRLRLGPFAGKPACTEIAFNRGVCGKAYSEGKANMVADVHDFADHIACDPESRSELVLPLSVQGELLGVLDIDSPIQAHFQEADAQFFWSALELLVQKNPDLKIFR